MPDALGTLEQRVAAAADLIAGLRNRVSRLESELASCRAAAVPPPGDQDLLEELTRLRAERGVVLERVRGLLKEIDRVSW